MILCTCDPFILYYSYGNHLVCLVNQSRVAHHQEDNDLLLNITTVSQLIAVFMCVHFDLVVFKAISPLGDWAHGQRMT